MTKFSEINLSYKTLAGLTKEHFVEMTPIQAASIPVALMGKDILGAAKTGSGKTLAFLIPILELLTKEQWCMSDGLGALVITPTRELALQIFEVLRKIGHKHSFSAGLVIGGKNLKDEQDKIARMNILVCTPGRLLQHMDQTLGFDTTNLRLLVLDEADRILDMGFSRTLDAILENLPKERQTMLFSATQASSVQDLARLSLKAPTVIQMTQASELPTPSAAQLSQHYVVCGLASKLDWLYSFVRMHLQSKMIVFVSSCKEVRFLYEAFCKLQPGIPVTCLLGKQKQIKRFAIFSEFCKRRSSLMFATDIAARGLDFPAVDWVVQYDCPESVETYIHRVGRTARYESRGSGLLLLLPSEERGMLHALECHNILVAKMELHAIKLASVQAKLAALCSQYPDLKYLGQKAIISYMKSVFIHGNKEIFNVRQLDPEEMATAFGLSSAPTIKFTMKSEAKNMNRQMQNSVFSDEDDEAAKRASSRLPALRAKGSHGAKGEEDDSQDDDLLQIKPHGRHMDDGTDADAHNEKAMACMPSGKKKKKKQRIEAAVSMSRTIFDDQGNAQESHELQTKAPLDPSSLKAATDAYLIKVKRHLEEADKLDREEDRKRRRAKKLSNKSKLKERTRGRTSQGLQAVLREPEECDEDDEDNKGDKDDKEQGLEQHAHSDQSLSEDESFDGRQSADLEALAFRLLTKR